MAECESPYFGFVRNAGHNAPRLAYDHWKFKNTYRNIYEILYSFLYFCLDNITCKIILSFTQVLKAVGSESVLVRNEFLGWIVAVSAFGVGTLLLFPISLSNSASKQFIVAFCDRALEK
jgi:hypothetical protein